MQATELNKLTYKLANDKINDKLSWRILVTKVKVLKTCILLLKEALIILEFKNNCLTYAVN